MELLLFKVKIWTSNLKDAGTDGRVFIQLHGNKTISDKHLVSSYKKDAFERGAVDEFLIESTLSLGSLTHLNIEHEGGNSSKRWHLDHVEVDDISEAKVRMKYDCPAILLA